MRDYRPSIRGSIQSGVYQIGDVYARSVIVMRVSGSGVLLKRCTSYAVQRGVGISITRA
jgi:hypothetical protein